jgi:tetratricopeptide (TPR) repeat protein/predicted Ser/Thr protein kinase
MQDDEGGRGSTVSATSPRASGASGASGVDADALQHGAAIGRYVVIERLGAGGMGVVYSAYDPDLDRRVAIKVLRPDLRREQSRLLREARAMARLSHPNVLSVHDVGQHNDHVFIAMELVDGTTLRKWLDESRPWRERLRALLDAGRGLAAAHGVGIVHRDFKPDNVMIGRDGGVRVLDFGVARATTSSTTESTGTVGTAVTITTSGGIVGTLAYMAPEQLAGESVDARADQFSFCVTLFEGLSGRRPFSGDSAPELLHAIREQHIDSAAELRIPAWIRAVLSRGLRATPADRYGSMPDLLGTLERDPSIARRRYFIATASALALAGVAVAASHQSRHHASLACEQAPNGWVDAWDAARRDRVRAAFSASRLPYATAAFATVAQALDRYVHKWDAMHADACRATWERREQSEALLDLRMSCLVQRRDGVKALTDLFAKADARTVEKSVQAAYSLEGVESCADAASLEAPLPPPADATARSRLRVLRSRLTEATALGDTGRVSDALAVVTPLEPESQALRYPPLTAELLLLEGDLRQRSSDAPGSASALRGAIAAAMDGRDDQVAAQAAMRLVYTVGYLQQRRDEGRFWGELAQAAIRRSGAAQPVLLARVLTNVSSLAHEEGKLDESVALLQRAISLVEGAEPDSPRLAVMLSNLAVTFGDMRRNEDALAAARRAQALREKTQGPNHPDMAYAVQTVAAILTQMKRYAEAVPELRRAVAIREASVGPDSWLTGITHSTLGDAYRGMADYESALASYRHAIAIYEKIPAPPLRLFIGAYFGVGKTQVIRGQAAAGVAPLQRALAIQQGAGGGPVSDSATIELGLARALWDSKQDRRRARELAQKARIAFASDARYHEDWLEADKWLAEHSVAASN